MLALQVDDNDNVAVVLQPIQEGDAVEVKNVTLRAREKIPIGHKIALCDIPAGGTVMKYGVPIGKAREAIPLGSHVHCHNVEDITAQLCQAYITAFKEKVGNSI